MSISRTRRGVRASLLSVGLALVNGLGHASANTELDYEIDVTETTIPEEDYEEDSCTVEPDVAGWTPGFGPDGSSTYALRAVDLNVDSNVVDDYFVLNWEDGMDSCGLPIEPNGVVYVVSEGADYLTVGTDCVSPCPVPGTTYIDFSITVSDSAPTGRYTQDFTLVWIPES